MLTYNRDLRVPIFGPELEPEPGRKKNRCNSDICPRGQNSLDIYVKYISGLGPGVRFQKCAGSIFQKCVSGLTNSLITGLHYSWLGKYLAIKIWMVSKVFGHFSLVHMSEIPISL